MLIPHGYIYIVDVITPIKILFRGGGEFWPLVKIKLMLLPQSKYCSEGVVNFNVMMIMMWWWFDDDDDEDDDHDDCKCGATSGLGRTSLNIKQISPSLETCCRSAVRRSRSLHGCESQSEVGCSQLTGGLQYGGWYGDEGISYDIGMKHAGCSKLAILMGIGRIGLMNPVIFWGSFWTNPYMCHRVP